MNKIVITESVTDSIGDTHEVEIATLEETPCGVFVEINSPCCKKHSCYSQECIAGRNLLQEIFI